MKSMKPGEPGFEEWVQSFCDAEESNDDSDGVSIFSDFTCRIGILVLARVFRVPTSHIPDQLFSGGLGGYLGSCLCQDLD